MGVIFRPTGPRPLSEFTVNVPDPSNKIRNQGLEVLRGWQKKSEFDKRNSQELLAALKENESIENKFRLKAFQTHEADNRRIASLIDKNFDTKIKNLDQEARNAKRKYDALAKLVPAVGTVMIEGDKALQKIANENYRKQQDGPGGASSTPPEATEKVFHKGEEARSNVDYSSKLAFIPPAKREEYVKAGRYKKRAMIAYHAPKEAEIAWTQASQPGGILEQPVFEDAGGGLVSWPTALRSLQNPSQVPYSVARQKMAKNYSTLLLQFSDKFKDDVYTGKAFQDYIKPVLAAKFDEASRDLDKRFNSGAEERILKSDFQASVGGTYNRFLKGDLKHISGGDPNKSADLTYNEFMSFKADGQSTGDRNKQWWNLIDIGVKSGALNRTEALRLAKVAGTIPGSDKIRTREEGGISANHPDRMENLLKTLDEVDIESAKKSKQLNEAIRVKNERELLLFKQTLDDNLGKISLEQGRVMAAKLPGPVRKKAFAYLQEPVIMTQLNAKMLSGEFERHLYEDLKTQDEWDEWIRSQKVTPEQKNVWREKVKKLGGGVNDKEAKYYEGLIDSAVVSKVGGGGLLYRQKPGDLHYTYSNHIRDVKLELRKAARLYKVQNESTWKVAYEQAYKSVFLDKWENRGNPDNEWYADPTPTDGVKRLKNRGEILGYNPYQEFRQEWSQDDHTGRKDWLNDGKLRNLSVMRGELQAYKYAVENNLPYRQGSYAKSITDLTGMQPTEFIEGYLVKYHNHPKFKENNWEKIDVKGENNYQLQAEKDYKTRSSPIQQTSAIDLPSEESSRIYTIDTQLNGVWDLNADHTYLGFDIKSPFTYNILRKQEVTK